MDAFGNPPSAASETQRTGLEHRGLFSTSAGAFAALRRVRDRLKGGRRIRPNRNIDVRAEEHVWVRSRRPYHSCILRGYASRDRPPTLPHQGSTLAGTGSSRLLQRGPTARSRGARRWDRLGSRNTGVHCPRRSGSSAPAARTHRDSHNRPRSSCRYSSGIVRDGEQREEAVRARRPRARRNAVQTHRDRWLALEAGSPPRTREGGSRAASIATSQRTWVHNAQGSATAAVKVQGSSRATDWARHLDGHRKAGGRGRGRARRGSSPNNCAASNNSQDRAVFRGRETGEGTRYRQKLVNESGRVTRPHPLRGPPPQKAH